MIDYRYFVEDSVYVLWIAGVNRYLQLQEPAFCVFEYWVKGETAQYIAGICVSRYSLSEAESQSFVNELLLRFQLLMENRPEEIDQPADIDLISGNSDYCTTFTYKIGATAFRFIYRNYYLEDLFHPLFQQFVCVPDLMAITATYELYTEHGIDVLKVDGLKVCELPATSVNLFQGTVYMQMLNTIHGMLLSDWMGVLHASAVTDGKKAVLFTAPSGSGKSTIAMLMIARGYASLSDDFVPVAIREPEVFHFPAGISVKPGTAALLKDQLPQLQHVQTCEMPGEELYIAPASNNIHPSVPACAIVFVKYDTELAFELKRESNLGMMNDLIRQSWIAGTPEAAERFLHWYFNLPVYSLRYSDNKSAVEGIIKLFG